MAGCWLIAGGRPDSQPKEEGNYVGAGEERVLVASWQCCIRVEWSRRVHHSV
jgi:hypothetical protein